MQARSSATRVLGVLALLVATHRVDAQSATQVVRFSVLPASRAAVEAVTKPLSTRGPSSVQSSYAIATSAPNRKLVASVDRTMPGLSLTVNLVAPAGASTRGAVTLNTTATDLLTSIPVAVGTDLPVRYSLRTDSAATTPAAGEREVTVTYTVVEQP